ncbi:MAG: hypothetical protein KJ760_10810, partial [Proteobacteria bacterium]|nr:hypothetical protein [Pseudomonadota bacterium]
MMIRGIVLGLMGLLFVAFFPVQAPAEEEDKSKVLETADKIIGGLPGALKTGIDFSKMTPQERINWVLNSVEDKVKSSVVEKTQDALKEKMEAYAKEAIRARAFMAVGAPQIRHAYAMGQSFDWSKIDSEIASSADTNMNRLGAGIKAAQVSWATIQAYRTGDFTSAAKTLGGEIGNLLAEAYIPGYGYFKAGAAMVELLGNYVLDYATDTAVEGMLDRLYGMKSDPQALAAWLIDKPPASIMKDIEDKFNDGMGFGYVYKGQGTDKGEAEIKARIQSELVKLRAALVTQQKEAERREKQAQREIDQYLQKYRNAEKALKAEAERIKAEADVQLSPVTEFKKKMTVLQKEDVQIAISQIESKMGEVSGGHGVPYVPFHYDSLISELESVYSEIKDSPGSGYDREAIDRTMSAYRKNREEAIKTVGTVNAENCRAAQQQVTDQYQPTLDSLERQRAAEKNYERRLQLSAQKNAVGSRYWAEMFARQAACKTNTQKLSLEMSAFSQEENIVRLEAQERADRLMLTIKDGFEKIDERLKQARRDRDEAKKALWDEIHQTLSFPHFFTSPGGYDQAKMGSGVSGTAQNIQKGNLQVYRPGELHNAREATISAIEKIKKDQELISALSNKERENLKKYQAQVLALKNEYESLVPENLRNPGGSNYTQEMQEYQSQEDSRVKEYGSSAAVFEHWQIFPPPLVRFREDPGTFNVEPPRYYDVVLAELDALAKSRVDRFKKAQRDWEQELQTVDFYADLDRIAVSIMTLSDNINGMLGRYLGSYPNFRKKNGVESIRVSAEESDGLKELENMEKAWESARPYVARMRKNVTAYGKGIQYLSSFHNPSDAIKRLSYYEAVPGQIEAHKKRMVEGEQQRLKTLKMIEDEIARITSDIESLKDPDKAMNFPITLRNLRLTFDQIFNIIKIDSARSYFKEEYEKLHAEMETYAKEHEEKRKVQIEKSKREYEAQLAREKAQERLKNEEMQRLEQERRAQAQQEQAKKDQAAAASISGLYEKFKQAYESRNDSQVLSFMGDDWEAGDGTTLSDLQQNLNRTFTMFDEVKYSIQNLAVTPRSEGLYMVSYDVTIT